MESINPRLKKRRSTSPYDDGTTSYSSPTTQTRSSGAGTFTTNTDEPAASAATSGPPTFYRNGNPLYYNTQRQGYREEGRKQYGLGSDYYKGLDEAGKLAFIKQVTGNDRFAQKYADPNANRVAVPGVRNPAMGIKNPFAPSKERMLEQAYSRAANNAYGLKGVKDPALVAQLGGNKGHREWKEVVDRVTGDSKGYYQQEQDSGKGGLMGDLKSNWDRNQAAWQAGIGAVGGLITGGPAGAVIGGLSGYASGSKVDKARKMARKLQRLEKKATFAEKNAPPRSMRDVARSRAAGAGTFNYTEEAEV